MASGNSVASKRCSGEPGRVATRPLGISTVPRTCAPDGVGIVTWGVGLATGAGQPFDALFTAWMMTATVTSASVSLAGSPLGQSDTCWVPRAMFTSLMISLPVTCPSRSQSPPHPTGVGVGVTSGVFVGLGVGV